MRNYLCSVNRYREKYNFLGRNAVQSGRRFRGTYSNHFRDEKVRPVGNRKKDSTSRVALAAFLFLMLIWLLFSEYLLLLLGLFFDHEDGDSKFMGNVCTVHSHRSENRKSNVTRKVQQRL
jgi:hypothetical protein